ncbi:glycosyltransferase family 2 protein [Mucilaginibacter sp. AK015]|uniref:glycosyltransferase family 2 protein n=1 Tax=Mucilaginibacter sp. AK015 TaxID=2723072 RepID=UPI00161FBAEB|nr:glycosyltransferase family 2 protein [Mucilaginibacter sp. AK015]MBB5395340.1 glycosyltransferase involved in cell wall biosynthesis [Mucilaginibacter sp. AK015]
MKFSILTPSYNSGKYIGRAINSVLAQDYKNWEHIIVDGASQDGTIEILKQYPHLKWVSAPDKGQSDAMNEAFKLSCGDIIMYLNADDELKPHALQTIAEAFAGNPDADMVICDLEIDHSGVKTVNSPATTLKQVLNYWPPVFPLNPVSYAYKKSLQLKAGLFPLKNHYSMDYWFLLRAFLKAKVLKINFVSGIFYFDGRNKSADAGNAKKWLKKVQRGFLYRYFYQPEVLKYLGRKIYNRSFEKKHPFCF